jgi:ArsR family transcriptional regulator
VALEDDLPDPSVLTPTVQLLKGFADDTRLRILCLLRGREVCVHEIVEALDMSQSAVSHQLRVLRDARLVLHRRDGRHVYYRLADDHVREMLENALSHGAENE